jgi:tetratricopeptide (TPR) repeat protein
MQEAVDLTPAGHPDQARRLQSLAAAFGNRYRKLEELKDMETALHTYQEAVDLTPTGHPDRAGRLQSLAVSLTDRYKRLGNLKDLEAALHTEQEAVNLTPAGHPDRAGRLQSLGVSLTEQYQRLGALKDLENALHMKQEAVDLTPAGHPDRALRLQSLAVSLTDRSRRLGDLKDLENALHTMQEAVDLTPAGHPDRAGRLQSLAVSLTDQYRRLGDLKDLEAALHTKQEAVDLTPAQHPDRAGRLQALAVSLTEQYQRLGDLKDLEAALHADQEAVDLTPAGHPDRAGRLHSLAISFRDQYERLRDPKDLATIHTLYEDSFKLDSMLPENSWEQALSWAHFAERFQSSDCISAFQAAFNLLPEILWIGHSIPVRHDAIRRLNISDVTSAAVRTCINLSDLCAAIEMLEQGLATIFQQMLQLKTDVDALPHQAKDFLALSSQLFSGTFTDSPINIVEDRKKLLEEIHNQPGFEYFLLPKSYNVLHHASQGGPVIILTSHKDQCDAIILPNSSSEPVHVPLQTVTLELLKSQRDMLKDLLNRCNARNRGQSSSSRLFGRREDFSMKSTQECFEDMLNWLWTHVVDPVYQVLKSVSETNGSFILKLMCPSFLSMVF